MHNNHWPYTLSHRSNLRTSCFKNFHGARGACLYNPETPPHIVCLCMSSLLPCWAWLHSLVLLSVSTKQQLQKWICTSILDSLSTLLPICTDYHIYWQAFVSFVLHSLSLPFLLLPSLIHSPSPFLPPPFSSPFSLPFSIPLSFLFMMQYTLCT